MDKKRPQRPITLALKIAALAACTIALPAQAAYVTTGWLSALQINMDNGRTYFSGGFTSTGNCLYDRLELRDSGDYFGSVENARRMYALILAARAQDKRIRLGYNDTDGPECRVAEVWIE
jgi:hypothetical protein